MYVCIDCMNLFVFMFVNLFCLFFVFVNTEGLLLIKASETTSSSAQKVARGNRASQGQSEPDWKSQGQDQPDRKSQGHGQSDWKSQGQGQADWKRKEGWQQPGWKKAKRWQARTL